MTTVRMVSVSGKDYLQVVQYIKKTQKGYKIKVVKSFGLNGLENRLKAEQFACAYDELQILYNRYVLSGEYNEKEFITSSLVLFGHILGSEHILRVGEEKRKLEKEKMNSNVKWRIICL